MLFKQLILAYNLWFDYYICETLWEHIKFPIQDYSSGCVLDIHYTKHSHKVLDRGTRKVIMREAVKLCYENFNTGILKIEESISLYKKIINDHTKKIFLFSENTTQFGSFLQSAENCMIMTFLFVSNVTTVPKFNIFPCLDKNKITGVTHIMCSALNCLSTATIQPIIQRSKTSEASILYEKFAMNGKESLSQLQKILIPTNKKTTTRCSPSQNIKITKSQVSDNVNINTSNFFAEGYDDEFTIFSEFEKFKSWLAENTFEICVVLGVIMAAGAFTLLCLIGT